MAQIITQQSLPPPPVINLPSSSLQATASAIYQFKKLSDTTEYNKDKDCLNVWKQSLKQWLHINHDRYLTNHKKITYAESWLTIEKKAHNLINQYWVNDLCTLINFKGYLQELYCLYKNPFKAENAYIYLCNTYKQNFMSFADYYYLFSQKKECS